MAQANLWTSDPPTQTPPQLAVHWAQGPDGLTGRMTQQSTGEAVERAERAEQAELPSAGQPTRSRQPDQPAGAPGYAAVWRRLAGEHDLTVTWRTTPTGGIDVLVAGDNVDVAITCTPQS